MRRACISRDKSLRAWACVSGAVPAGQMQFTAGYDDQDHYYYASGSLKMATKILQQPGILKYVNDDTA